MKNGKSNGRNERRKWKWKKQRAHKNEIGKRNSYRKINLKLVENSA